MDNNKKRNGEIMFAKVFLLFPQKYLLEIQ